MLRKSINLILFSCVIFSLLQCKNKNEELSICFTGDLLLDRGVRSIIELRGVDSIFSNVSPLFRQTDFVVCNLECPITINKRPINKQFIFRAEPEWLSSLKLAGITHLAMANNHTNDQNRDGLVVTSNEIIANKMIPIGFGMNYSEACKPVLIEKGHIKVAIFNSVTLPLENFPFLPDKPCVCQSSTDELSNTIYYYKKSNPTHFVIVLLHWGQEYHVKPSISQRVGAIKLVKAGADAIIGHHPHVVQAIEFINDKPIIYSLGNFVFDPLRQEATKGLMVKLIISDDKLKIIGYKILIDNCRPSVVEKYNIKN